MHGAAPFFFGAMVDDRAELAASVGLEEANPVSDTPAQVLSTGASHTR